jgi:tetratricopeptide (TPR) repeat protein
VTRAPAALTLVAAALACAPDAAAQEKQARVAVFMLPAAGYRAADVAGVHHRLMSELAQNTRLDVKDSDKLLVEFAGEVPTDRINQARGALEKGIELLRAGSAGEALGRLSEAVAAYEEVLPFVKKEQLARSMLALGVAQAAARQPKKALATFQSLLTWRFGIQYDEGTFDPAHRQLFDRARALVKKSKRGSVELVTDPPGARVYVDGKSEGAAPRVVFGLRVGDHYATYKHLGYIKATQKITVSPTEQTRVTFKLRQSEKYLIIKQSIDSAKRVLGQAQANPDMISLRAVLFVDQIVFATMGFAGPGKISIQAYLYDLRSKQRLNYVIKTVDLASPAELRDLAQSLYTNVRLDGALDAPPEPPPPPPPKRRRFYATWWFWTAIAVGVAAVAVPIAVWPEESKCDPSGRSRRCVNVGN